MFEKETEEYSVGKAHEHYNYLFEKHAGSPVDFARWCFKDGAEFGYNKANEWHKQDIDDIYDLISKDWGIKYFICIMKDKRRLAATGYCDEDLNGGINVCFDFDHDDDKYYIDDLVWWKELVLPKE